MFLREIYPSIALTDFVRLYRIIDFQFPNPNPIPPKAYTPRPEQCLQFFPTPTKFEYPNSTKSIIPKNALLIGQHTVINNRTIYQKFLSVQVIFQPGALYSLLGIPLNELTNQLIEAEDLFGSKIVDVNEQLFFANSHQNMIEIIEHFLMQLIRTAKLPFKPVDLVAKDMLTQLNKRTIDWYSSSAFLCHRQFDRKFKESIGITPKTFLRLIRFDLAYRIKNLNPQQSWFNIAIDCGYNDYQHLSKDYRDFTGYTPTSFFRKKSPERLLGMEEIY